VTREEPLSLNKGKSTKMIDGKEVEAEKEEEVIFETEEFSEMKF